MSSGVQTASSATQSPSARSSAPATGGSQNRNAPRMIHWKFGGGTLAILRDGDKITIDAEKNRIDVAVGDAELAARKAAFKAPPYKATRGTLYKFIKNVKNASEGCVTDE